MFLTPEEVAALTGIRRGRCKRTREQLQIAQLVKMGIPHFVNAALAGLHFNAEYAGWALFVGLFVLLCN